MKTKFWIALLLLFASGLALGFFGGRAWEQARFHAILRAGPPRIEDWVMNKLEEQLKLTDEQLPVIREIVQRTAAEIHRIRDEGRQAFHACWEKALVEIRPGLTEDQRARLDAMDADDLRPRPFKDAPPPEPPPENKP
ncbi:MAG TPA: hypothetical protein P5567_05170 [Kiritimatiellia bacterium]|nr:hypothetical protein [Kiritimatiellia bacterium]HRZ11827.1 hypothetical protein [Kiritimatiellia bacterium]HSA17367.1 hypothetical protein [Kiritimatiellia bacterium]